MTMRRFFVPSLLLTLLLPLGCESQPERVTATGPLFRSDAESITIGGELFYTNEAGIRISHLRFDTAYQWVGDTERDLSGVDLLIFNEDGTERARLTSERGEADFEGRQMKAMGNVVLAVTGDGRRIESEELNFDPYGDRIWTDSAFVSTRPGERLEGCSFTSDLKFTSFRITGRRGC
jgi:LPS export ABC transporter protein LptC